MKTTLALLLGAFAAAAGAAPLALHTLDCGHAAFDDFAAASDTGEYDGRPAELADPCFLIEHRDGWLLWDAGLPIGGPAVPMAGVRLQAPVPLDTQMRALGITPADVRYVAFSHLHFDHVGQANLFTHSTWIIERAELDWALAEPAHVSMAPALISGRTQAKTLLVDGDHDVFGDGSVRILKAPGHTPGSSVLLVKLARSGPVILSGDLYLTREGRESQQVPAVNADRAQTLASMARIERIARNLNARIVVQHDPRDFSALPKRLD